MKLIILALILSSCSLLKVAEEEAEGIIRDEAEIIREKRKERQEKRKKRRELKKSDSKKKEAVSG